MDHNHIVSCRSFYLLNGSAGGHSSSLTLLRNYFSQVNIACELTSS